MTADHVDLFAGAGGWDIAARALGFDPVGIELDETAVATRRAASLPTIHGDVAALEPGGFAPCEGVIASPPCPTFSASGNGAGALDMPEIEECAAWLAKGHDRRGEIRPNLADARSLLVVEPLRWALALEPRWVALEQVPSVLPFWRQVAELLEERGYHTWAGKVNAADYGVPQTRERAILLAHRDRTIVPPEPTHADPRRGLPMFAAPWVSMGDAVGWPDEDLIGFPRLNDRDSGGAYRERDRRPATLPAFNLTEKARSWTRLHARGNTKGGTRPDGLERGLDEPAFTLTSRSDQWRWRSNRRANATERRLDEPAPTITGGHDHQDRAWTNGEESIPVTLEEAAALQTFPVGYPWQGSRTAGFRQVGNAVPPLLAYALLAHLVD